MADGGILEYVVGYEAGARCPPSSEGTSTYWKAFVWGMFAKSILTKSLASTASSFE